MKFIKEGKAKIHVETPKIVSKELEVFYNPVMEFNRSVSVALLNSINNKKMQISDPLCASGVRGIRFLKELPKSKIEKIFFNDNNKKAIKNLKENLKLNKIKFTKSIKSKVSISNNDAVKFIINEYGFDYIDIDPFGSPVKFLDSACSRLARDGILAITATDTGALSGSFSEACQRKYWAIPLRNELMHEIGLRILIRRVQLAGSVYDKALIPILSYSKEHYMRIFFYCEKGKEKVDEILKSHKFFEFENNKYGPIWLGKLGDSKILKKVIENYGKIYGEDLRKSDMKFLKKLYDESKIDCVGFYDMHSIGKKYKLDIPRKEELMKKLKKSKIKASFTHFSETGLKAECSLDEFVKYMKMR